MAPWCGKKQFYSIVLPDRNNCGAELYQGNNIINTPCAVYDSLGYGKRSGLHNLMKIDFGQKNCIQCFEEQFACDEMLDQSQKPTIMFYAIGHGCPTLINWLTRLPEKMQKQLVGCILLESVIGSGNNAIMHSTKSHTKTVTYLPFARSWIPWAAKAFSYSYYNPEGPQLLTSIAQLSTDIPVVITHDIYDSEADINDAREAYCILREKKNDNAYLLETNCSKSQSIERITENKKKISAIQKIYKKHGLPHNKAAKRSAPHVDLNEFQPAVADVQNRIALSVQVDENIRDYVDFGTIAVGIGAAVVGALNYCH